VKSTSELTDFYYNELYPDLQELEKERKALRSKVIGVFGFITLITLGIIYMVGEGDGDGDGVFFVGALGFAIAGFAYKLMIKDYTFEFKEKIIRPLIKAIDDNLKYSPTLHIPQHLFTASRLFTKDIDRFSGNDLVRGDIGDVNLSFSDIHAEYETRDSKGKSSWHTIFRGLFIAADFNKHFKGSTVILPDSAEKTFGSLIGGWLQKNNIGRNDLVKMDNPEFEKAFVVYGSDQIEARYILTHSMMKRLLDYKERTQQDIYISFINTKIHLGIYYDKDLFEPTLFTSLLDYKQAISYTQTLQLSIGIVEELKLNEKLWSKV